MMLLHHRRPAANVYGSRIRCYPVHSLTWADYRTSA